jgi:hypothetical protein
MRPRGKAQHAMRNLERHIASIGLAFDFYKRGPNATGSKIAASASRVPGRG